MAILKQPYIFNPLKSVTLNLKIKLINAKLFYFKSKLFMWIVGIASFVCRPLHIKITWDTDIEEIK
jgi:hypothetical protein